jgi:hypothetical protein
MTTQPQWCVVANAVGLYRAELWVRPYSGWMMACTRTVSTKTWATRDGKRIFGQWEYMVKRTADVVRLADRRRG